MAKLRKRTPFWQLVGSQAVQDICQRIEKAYQQFFKHDKKGVRPPGFLKVRRYKSLSPMRVIVLSLLCPVIAG